MTKPKIAIVVLAAGLGMRMKSDVPKVLHPLAGRPIVAHVMATATALKPDRTVVVVGPEMGRVAAAVAPVRTVIQEERLGTGHAVMAARQTLQRFRGDVLILFGDTPLLTPATLRRLLKARRSKRRTAVAVLGMRPADPGEYGRLILAADGSVERIAEFRDASPAEKKLGLCNSGVMAVDAAILPALLDGLSNDNAKGEYYLTDIVGLARDSGLSCAQIEADADELLGVNSRSDLAQAEAILQTRLRQQAMAGGATLIDPASVYFSLDTKIGSDVTIEPNVVFGPGVTVGDRVVIRAFCHIDGASIREGAAVGPFARLRPGTEIGENAHIGNFVEIKKADIEPGAKVNHLSYIGDARIGAKANIGAGTITCNYDGFDKHRTDVGEGAFIGSNTALVAPVRVGDGAVVGAGSVITRDVPDDALAVERSEQRFHPGWGARFRASKRRAKAELPPAKDGEPI
ncbi:MAG: bifunctional UDP-N-acetylglucosamine diphosphorylase/glucosamine-1-phosphate N-acetyltransferase GlmU [Rhodospirillaceae bacterium]|nr:bifunctional UDP-N-acetylglucosamine diphosphorylase/glucosamine-1-phosphate N-acetyltransferase GlmU [Rhodospirillaceae bacterium]